MTDVLIISDYKEGSRSKYLMDRAKQDESLLRLETMVDGRYMSLPELVEYCRKGTEADTGAFSMDGYVTLNGIYLHDYLKRHEIGSVIISNFVTQREEFFRLLEKENPVVVISTTFLDFGILIRIIGEIREQAPGLPVIIGGPLIQHLYRISPRYFTLHKQELNGCFLVFGSDGEGTLVRLVMALKNKTSVEKLPNIGFFNRENRFTVTVMEPEMIDPDEAPIRWDELDFSYTRSIIPVMAGKGCAGRCKFCNYWQLNPKPRLKSMGVLEEELQRVRRLSHVRHLWIVDNSLGTSAERLADFCRMLIRMNFPVGWSSFIYSRAVTRETARLLRESGFLLANMALETFSESVCEKMNQSGTPKQHRRAIEYLHELNIPVSAEFIVGLPGETSESLAETTAWIKQMEVEFCEFALWMHFPGTQIAEEATKFSLKGSFFDWEHETMDSSVAKKLMEEIFASLTDCWCSPLYDAWSYLMLLRMGGYTFAEIRRMLKLKNEFTLKKLRDGCGDEHEFLSQFRAMACGMKPR